MKFSLIGTDLCIPCFGDTFMDLRLKFKTKFKGKQNVKLELFMLPHLGTLHLRRLLLSNLLLYSHT